MTQLNDRYTHAVMNTFGPPKLALTRGEGCYVWDTDGKRYLDLLGGIAVNALGHAHPAVVETLCRQAQTLSHVSNFFTTEPQVRLAERLLELLDCGDGRVFLASSGTEANEAALKLTRRTGRTKVVAAEGAFHGRTMGALALTAKASYREPFEPLPGDVVHVPYGDADALRAAVDDATAAVLLEPVQGEAGVIVPPEGYLEAARAIADEAGALLWFDEVQCGVGRCGDWFAFQAEDVRPDIVTLAKGLGGGFPIGACIGFGDAGHLLSPGQHGTTFGGNPLGAATALTVLDVIEKDGLRQQASIAGARLRDGLSDLEGVASVRGRGLLLAAEVGAEQAKPVTNAALERGAIINDCTPETLRFAPPLIITDDQVDEALSIVSGALAAVGGIEAGP